MSIEKTQPVMQLEGLTLDLVQVFAPNFPSALKEVADHLGRAVTMTFRAYPDSDEVGIQTETGEKPKVIDAEVVSE